MSYCIESNRIMLPKEGEIKEKKRYRKPEGFSPQEFLLKKLSEKLLPISRIV